MSSGTDIIKQENIEDNILLHIDQISPDVDVNPISLTNNDPLRIAPNIKPAISTSSSITTVNNNDKKNTNNTKRKIEPNNNKSAASKKRKKSNTNGSDSSSNDNNDSNNDNNNNNNNGPLHSSAGHRPVTSCTHCRQHKIKCNASEKFPDPCSRCQRMNLKCEIDPRFRPKKGSQIQSLRNDVDELRSKIEYLTRNENLMAQVLQKAGPINLKDSDLKSLTNSNNNSSNNSTTTSPSLIAKTHLNKEPILLSLDGKSTPLINDSAINKTSLNPALEAAIRNATESPAHFGKNDMMKPPSSSIVNDNTNLTNNTIQNNDEQIISIDNDNKIRGTQLTTPVNTKPISQNILPNGHISEFILGDVKIDIEKAETLHKRFIENYLPFLPIMVSNNPVELYQQSQLLFWTVILTACLSDPEPGLYNSFASLIKQLAIETCWIRTPRSTHIVQSLLILGTWPLPNQKVLDDCSYRFIGLAKNLSLQLGLHRGKFMTEFTRTQVALPDAEKWRSRTWLAVFFCEQFWSSNLGLPPSLQTDYLLERARIDNSLPKNFRCLISLAIFQAKLVNIMGLNVSSPDGLMEPANRAGPLHILERELERLAFKLEIDDLIVECYYLYVKLMVCLFSFLPETPSEDQTKYVTIAYHSATRIVTIMSRLLENKQLTELPIYVRHSVTTAAFILFRLHLTPYLLPKYIDSSRQSIVTVHRLYRNMLAAWKDVENDISRTATVLEKLNFVIITHPDLFTNTEGIIVRMRSHLTGSLFYDLVWNIHEGRRRTIEENSNKNSKKVNNLSKSSTKKPLPLPFYNQITKDDFTAITTTTPNGTTVTTLVPTDQAIINAKASAFKAGLSKPTEINGIPLAMLEATGSLSSKQNMKKNGNSNNNNSNNRINNNSRNNGFNNNNTNNNKTTTSKNGKNEQLNKSTSMNAAVNGLVPPPLFPNNSRLKTTTFNNLLNVSNNNNNNNNNNNSNNSLSNDSNLQGKDSNIGSNFKAPRRATIDQSYTPHSVLTNEKTEMTPVNLTGLDNLFESPSMPISINKSPSTEEYNKNLGTSNSNSNSNSNNLVGIGSTSQSPTDSDLLNEMFIDSIFQQNSGKPNEDDDLLGWFDMNMAPEF